MDYYLLASLSKRGYESFSFIDKKLEANLFIFSNFLKSQNSVLKEWESLNIEITKDSGKTKVDFPIGGTLLITEKVKKILEENINVSSIDFLKVSYEKENFFYIHSFNQYDFSDIVFEEKSKVSFFHNGLIDLFGSEFCISKNFKEDIFSFKKHSQNIIVSKKVKDLLEKEKVKGCNFRRIAFKEY